MKKKLLIFPFDREAEPLVQCCDVLNDYTIQALVAFPGSGLIGRQYNTADSFLEVVSDFSSALENCDVVLVSTTWYEIDFQSFIFPRIKDTILKSKKVICSKKSFEQNKDLLSRYADAGNLTILPEPKYRDGDSQIAKINAPVVYVAGIAQNTGKFATEIFLKREIEKAGYRVSLIASRAEASLFGVTAFPSFVFKNEMGDSEIIYSFSHIVKQIEIHEKPDIILLGIPGAILPYSRKHIQDFGLLGIKLNYAVPPDLAVLCTLCPVESRTEYFFQGLDRLFLHTYNADVAYHFISKYTFDFVTVDSRKKYEYLTLPSQFVELQQSSIGRAMCSKVGDASGVSYAADQILAMLT